jgi:hypothetical protein
MQAQGRGLLVTHGKPAPQRWWRKQAWSSLEKLLPSWLIERLLEVFRPLLGLLDTQIAALTAELENAAPKDIAEGIGKLTSVTVDRGGVRLEEVQEPPARQLLHRALSR